MKGFAMLKIGATGWVEKDRPKCGPMDAFPIRRKHIAVRIALCFARRLPLL